jgi:DNA-binding transcriptional MerR regulator
MDSTNYSFKEICKKTGYASSAIRYYEKEFNLLIPRDANGRRYFTKVEFDKLLFIKELQDQNYTNGQIKKMLNDRVNMTSIMNEVALTTEIVQEDNVNSLINSNNRDIVINFIDEKFKEVNNTISELNQNINSKERDLLISENMKLKMEIKRKSYEIIELKENLRFYKGKNKGIFSKIFGKKS